MRALAPRWAWVLATGMGSGLLRPASGTWGSMAGLAVWYLLSSILLTPFTVWASGHQTNVCLVYYSFIIELLIIIFILSTVWLAVFVSNLVTAETGEEDPHYIVIDEWVGMWIALWPMRWEIANKHHGLLSSSWWWLTAFLIPFFIFRLLDVWKPWPIRQIQVLPAGQGIVVDDVVAGLCSMPIVMLLTPLVVHLTK